MPKKSLSMITPVNWLHPLNRPNAVNARAGLLDWWKILPGIRGGRLTNLVRPNHGILTDMASTDWSGSKGRLGSFGELHFNGTNGLISIENEGAYDFNFDSSFTLTAWARRDDSTAFDHVIGKFDETGQQGYRFILQPTSGFVDNADSVLVDIFASGLSGIRVSTPTNSIVVGEFQHLTLTYAGVLDSTVSNVRFYINGINQPLTTSLDNLGGSLLMDEPFTIGSSSNPITHPMIGNIDDVRVYNRVLNATEVNFLYRESKKEFSDLHYWIQDQVAFIESVTSGHPAIRRFGMTNFTRPIIGVEGVYIT